MSIKDEEEVGWIVSGRPVKSAADRPVTWPTVR